MKKIDLEKMTIEFIASNILLITIKDGVTIEDYDVIEGKKLNLELTNGISYAVLFDTGDYTTFTQEARDLMSSSKIEENRIASAFIINSLAQRLVGNFYLRVNKPKVHTKMFSEKEKAMRWIKEILAKY